MDNLAPFDNIVYLGNGKKASIVNELIYIDKKNLKILKKLYPDKSATVDWLNRKELPGNCEYSFNEVEFLKINELVRFFDFFSDPVQSSDECTGAKPPKQDEFAKIRLTPYGRAIVEYNRNTVISKWIFQVLPICISIAALIVSALK